jgi:hypothetical protein
MAGTVTNVEQIAATENCTVRQINMTISLAFLAPNLVQAAVDRRLPRGVGIANLLDAPAEWSLKYARLGLASCCCQGLSPESAPPARDWSRSRICAISISMACGHAGRAVVIADIAADQRRNVRFTPESEHFSQHHRYAPSHRRDGLAIAFDPNVRVNTRLSVSFDRQLA